MTEKTTLALNVVIDVVCPWCYVGKRRLEQALALVPDVDFAIRYRPFQLDATLPQEGVDHKTYMLRKFGDANRVAEAQERLAGIGRDIGIDFRFDAIRFSPNTLNCHRLIKWAAEAEVADDVVARLYRIYFAEGGNLGDMGQLACIAGEAGMNGSEVLGWLKTDVDRDEIEAEVRDAQRIGITGVPCIIIENKYAVTGAQEPETLAAAFREIAQEKTFGRKS